MAGEKSLPFYEAEAKERMSLGGGDKKSEEYKKSGTQKVAEAIQESLFDEEVESIEQESETLDTTEEEKGEATEKAAKDYGTNKQLLKVPEY